MKTKIFVKLFTITFTLTFRIIFENVLIAKCLRKVLENIGYIGGGRHSSVDESAPTSRGPRFEYQAHHLCFCL